MKPINLSSSPNLNMPGRREPGIRGFGARKSGRTMAVTATIVTAQKKG